MIWLSKQYFLCNWCLLEYASLITKVSRTTTMKKARWNGIPTGQELKNVLSVTPSVTKSEVHSVLVNLLWRNVEQQAHHRWTDRQTITCHLLTWAYVYPTFLHIKPRLDLHLLFNPTPIMLITGNSIFLEKKTQTQSGQLPNRKFSRFHQ